MLHIPIIIIPIVRQPSVLWDGRREARDWKRETVKSEDEQAGMSGGLVVRVYDRMECSYRWLRAGQVIGCSKDNVIEV